MPPFPKGPDELARAGYIYLNDGICKGEECGAIIHWYKSPTGQIMPIDSIAKTPHWMSCPGAKQFRKRQPKPPPVELQRNMFEREPGED